MNAWISISTSADQLSRIYFHLTDIEGAHHPVVERSEVIKTEPVNEGSEDIGGSAGQIISALRYKLKDKDKESNPHKCLICMVGI